MKLNKLKIINNIMFLMLNDGTTKVLVKNESGKIETVQTENFNDIYKEYFFLDLIENYFFK